MVKRYCKEKDDAKVFTFGIGNDCDRQLVKEVAEAGGGSYNFATDADLSVLKSKVIDALSQASEPALIGCYFDFGIGSGLGVVDDQSLMNPT